MPENEVDIQIVTTADTKGVEETKQALDGISKAGGQSGLGDEMEKAADAAERTSSSVEDVKKGAEAAADGAGEMAEGFGESSDNADSLTDIFDQIGGKIGISGAALLNWVGVLASVGVALKGVYDEYSKVHKKVKELTGLNPAVLSPSELKKSNEELAAAVGNLTSFGEQFKRVVSSYAVGGPLGGILAGNAIDKDSTKALQQFGENLDEITRREERLIEVDRLKTEGKTAEAEELQKVIDREERLRQIRGEAANIRKTAIDQGAPEDVADSMAARYRTQMELIEARKRQAKGESPSGTEELGKDVSASGEAASASLDGAAASIGGLGEAITSAFASVKSRGDDLQRQISDLAGRVKSQAA
jgi:hypothetical protein